MMSAWSKFHYVLFVIFVLLNILGTFTYWSMCFHRCHVENSTFLESLYKSLSADVPKIKELVLTSKWIRYFPHLKDMASKVIITPPISKTSAKKTRVILDTTQRFHKGGELHATITAHDGDGLRKRYGGDVFIAILRPSRQNKGGVSCPIDDQMDGTYAIKCILPFEGDVELRVKMLHPSESIFKMMARYSSTQEYETIMKTKMRNSKGHLEYVNCSPGFPDERPGSLCNYTNPTHGEQYMCLKPPSGECNPLLSQKMRPNMQKLRFWDDVYFVKDLNYNAYVDVIKVHIMTSTSSLKAYRLGDTTTVSLQPMEATGWFEKQTLSAHSELRWVSRKVDVQPYSVKNAKKCLKDKEIYFVGDSTIRQWYLHLMAQFNLKDNLDPKIKDSWSRPRNCYVSEANITMYFRAHGPPFHNDGDIWPYISDVLDHVTKGGNGTVVILTIGYHFHLFNPDVFLDRITRIKSAVTSLLTRLPGSKVIIKGLHYHEPRPPFVTSPWKTRLLETIIRNVFNGVRGVHYLETWDFMLLIGNDLVHPLDDVVNKIIAVMMSYVC